MKEKNAKSKTAKVKSKSKNAASAENAALVKENAPDTALVVPTDSLNASGVLDAVDSSNAVGDAGPVDGDSTGMPVLPTAEQLGITITAGNAASAGNAAGNAPLSVTVGDTINFPVTVSWSVNGSAILVVPTSSANAKGLLQLGVSQESSRSVKDGTEWLRSILTTSS